MNRIFKYLISSIIIGVTVFYAVYYTKGEYNYMAIPTAFLINGPIYFSRKKTQFSKLTFKNKWNRLWNFSSGAFIIGIDDVVSEGQQLVNNGALAGMSGLGHIALSIGLVWTIVKIFQYESAK